MTEPLTPEYVMSTYVTLRDKRSELKKEYEEKDKKFKDAMDKLEGWLLFRLDEAGTDTFKNGAGTAYVSHEVKVSCPDWPNFWEWCAANKRVDMLEKRVSSTAVKEYQEEHGELPPFVNVVKERVVRVRRA